MLAMEYGTVGIGVQQLKYACSTMSSETISESCGSRNNRVRTVRLVRPAHGPLPPPGLNYRHGPSLGFSLRGGREHGTGFFVSHVEIGSEAHAQGLRVGDQIIRINGFTVDDAVHKEVLQLISNHIHLTLKVRGVGMIPVKDRKTDSLGWQIITDTSSSPSRESPQLGDKISDVRINIMVAPKSKLGCGICKGPEWKPGIFVQFTKEGGIAREAGLRPGDQILYCNNVDFSDIQFNEAVNLMKSARQLNLIVRKSAGSELFPGESSGYNSSASSVTGDQSPSWSDSKRLSIVKEENLDLEERLNHLDRYKNLVNVNKWDSWDEEPEEKPIFKPTIINLSENGTTIQNNGSEEQIYEDFNNSSSCHTLSNKNNDFYSTIQQFQRKETKTVVVEVHRTDVDEKGKTENGHAGLVKSPSTSSFCSIASKSSCTSSVTSSSLSSAITEEIQRRSQKKSTEQQKPSIDEQLQMKKILKGVSSDKQYQHSKLMDEFKKAHQKMFKATDEDEADSSSKSSSCLEDRSLDRLNNNTNNKDLTQKLTERLSNLHNGDTKTKRLTLNKTHSVGSCPPPPPPPPQKNGLVSTLSTPSSSTPSTRSNTLKNTKSKPKAPPVPVKYSVLSYNQSQNQPPPCPTPDYDTLSLASTTSSSIVTSKPPPSQKINDSVEMDSLESFRLTDPNDVKPKPPNIYFQKRKLVSQPSNQSTASESSSIRRSRPISVTIGEYPSMRRHPGRLDFLQNGGDEGGFRKDESIGSRLNSELTQTLNRSNLRKRTESMENLLSSPEIKPQNNGGVRISLSNLSKAFAKSTSDLTADHYGTLPGRQANCVTINVNQSKSDTPNGILKNGGNTSFVDSVAPTGHKPLATQKSITFGEMPTLIKDRSLETT